MKNTRIRFFFLLAFCAAMLNVGTAEAQPDFQKSAKWVPSSANCLVMVQAEKIFDSPIAQAENWSRDRSAAFRSGASFLPPSTVRLLIASQIDFEFMESVYNVGVFEKKGKAIDIIEVSKRITGDIEKIGDKDALKLPNESYLVQIDDKTLVSMTPANRQLTSRWISSKIASETSVSPYLSEAIQFADQNAQIIVAFDLANVISEQEIAKRLSESTVVKNTVEETAKALSTIKGLTLGVTVRDKITGSIKIDFNENPNSLLPVAKDILMAALSKNGLMIDDIKSWNVMPGDNQIRLSGPLSSEGLSQIGSLIHQPIHDDFSGASQLAGSGEDPSANTATRTLQYFGDVQHVLEMIRRKDLGQLDTYSKWFSRYARQIDGISSLGVDPVMVDYGTYIANAFRDVSGGMNTANLEKNKNVAAQGFSGPGSRSWNYGYGYGTINSRRYTRNSRRSASAIGTEAGANEAKDIMREIDSETAKVSRAMSEKYQIEFEISDR